MLEPALSTVAGSANSLSVGWVAPEEGGDGWVSLGEEGDGYLYRVSEVTQAAFIGWCPKVVIGEGTNHTALAPTCVLHHADSLGYKQALMEQYYQVTVWLFLGRCTGA